MGQVNKIIKENPSHIKKSYGTYGTDSKSEAVMKAISGTEWQPMPRECREQYQIQGSAVMHSLFVPEVQGMLKYGEIEVPYEQMPNMED